MRLATALVAIDLAFSGTTARAQAMSVPQPSVPSGQPSFHVPMDLPPLRTAKGPSLRDISEPAFESTLVGPRLYTCPMPVAKPGCSNPLDRVR